MFYLRTLEESDTLRAAFKPDTRVVIVGAGWIGLEAAAAAQQGGSAVTIVEAAADRALQRARPRAGREFAALHREHGVEFRFGESSMVFRPAEVSGKLPASGDSREGWPVGWVITSSGAELPADVVVVGIGAVPNDGLAQAAGLDVDNGVLTDAALRTSDADIFAAGDVGSSYLPLLGRHVRLDHWANALHGGQEVAKSMLGQPVEDDGWLTSTATSMTSAWSARACRCPAAMTRPSTEATARLRVHRLLAERGQRTPA